jgi:hypothetical protein
LSFREISKIIKEFRRKQQNESQPQEVLLRPTREELRARELLENLSTVYQKAYHDRKHKWYERHGKSEAGDLFCPTLEEELSDTELDEWFYYFINRIRLTPEQRYQNALRAGCLEIEALKEKNKNSIDILKDYQGYQDYDIVLKIWTENE